MSAMIPSEDKDTDPNQRETSKEAKKPIEGEDTFEKSLSPINELPVESSEMNGSQSQDQPLIAVKSVGNESPKKASFLPDIQKSRTIQHMGSTIQSNTLLEIDTNVNERNKVHPSFMPQEAHQDPNDGYSTGQNLPFDIQKHESQRRSSAKNRSNKSFQSIDSQFSLSPSKQKSFLDEERFKLQYRRQKTDLDTASFFNSMQSYSTKAEDNMDHYKKNYSIEFSLPTVYVNQALIYQKCPVYNICLVRYICSQHTNLKHQVTTHSLNGKVSKSNFGDIYSDKPDSLMLRVNLREHQSIRMVDEINIKSKQGIMDLNNDGSMFALFMQDIRKIQICSIESDRIGSFVHKVRRIQQGKKTKGFSLEFSTSKIDLRFVQKLEFDKKNRFLVGYGECKIFFLNIMTQDYQIHAVSSRKFAKICSVNFQSTSDTQFKCFVACERKGIKQICTFDLFEDLKLREINNKVHHGQKLKSEIAINFQNELEPDYKVMIDIKCRQVVLANGQENCLVEFDGGYQTQRLIPKTQNKEVLMFKRDLENGGFYCVCRKKFDRFIRIYHTDRPEFKFRFERVVEAKLILTHDLHIQSIIDEDGMTKKEMRIISMEDDHFLIDRVDFREISSFDKVSYVDQKYQYFTISQISAFSFSWPYVCFSGINNYICIVSSFNKSNLTRIEIAPQDQCVTICKTHITDTDDLFILISYKDIYKLYQIDLDEFEQNQKSGSTSSIKPILLMQYSNESVANHLLDQIHIRGSSRKKLVDINQKLEVFLLHGQNIYSWIKKDESFEEPVDLCQLNFVSKCTSFMYPKDDEQFIFLRSLKNEKKELTCQDIIQVTCNFSTYTLDTVYEEMSQSHCIKCVKYDPTKNNIIILTKSKGIRNGTLDIIYTFKIFDMDAGLVMIDIPLKNEERIGRLKSGLFSLIDGHMYFSNDLIKIRLDLIKAEENKVGNMYQEDQLFDDYMDIFKLEGEELVRSRTPLISLTGNRFCFIISDQNKKNPLQVFIIPFLHEKRIELGKDNQKNIFYTAIETPIEQEEVYLNELMISMKKNLELNIKNIINYDKLTANKKKKRRSILEGSLDIGLQGVKMGASGIQGLGEQGLSQFTGNKKPSQMRSKIQKDQFTSIVAFDQDQCKYKVYNQQGILINEIDFSDKVEKYGYPIATSNNGQIFIFKKTDEQLEDEMLDSQFLNPEKDQELSAKSQPNFDEEFLTIHVIQMTIYGMVWVKSINLQQSILKYMNPESSSSPFADSDFYQFLKLNNWIERPSFEKMRNTLVIKCQINDNKDVLVEIYDKNAFSYQRNEYGKVSPTSGKLFRSVFYWEAANKIQEKETGILDIANIKKLNPINQLQEQKILVDSFVFQSEEPSLVKMVMNNDYIFKWEVKNIYFFELGNQINNKNGKKLMLSIDPRDPFSSTKEIICGSNGNEVVIVIENSQVNTKTVLTWNMKKNIQEEAYEMKEEFIVIWDINGSPYIIADQNVYFTNKRCMITAYEIKGLVKQLNSESSQTTFDHKMGHKVDFKNHNWILLKDALSLSFSYLTFVIQDKIENNDPCLETNVFDLTPYNYIFNKNTAFIQGDFVAKDHQMLAEVLQHISNVDMDHLMILNYSQDVYQFEEHDFGDPQKNSALHRAVNSGNQRSTDLILEWLSKLDYNTSKNYVSIFGQLTEQKGFFNYFNKLYVQTEIMKKKMILRSNGQLNEIIIKMTSSPCEYIDDEFFKIQMDEKDEYQSYPVDIVAIRVGWIMTHQAGKAFLSKILDEGDLSLYEIKSLQIIIEFLFEKYKMIILLLVTPLYVLSQITFETLLSANDAYLSNLYEHKRDGWVKPEFLTSQSEDLETDRAFRNRLVIFGVINFIAMLIQLIMMLALFKSSGFSYFKKLYGILDCAYIFFTINIYIKIMETFEVDQEESDFVRKVQNFRTIACLATITLYVKATYFFSLIDAAAPLVDIIFKVIFDIKWFMIIMFFYLLMLGKCFQLLGTNQLEFDNLSEEEIESLTYLAPGGTKTEEKINRIWWVSQFALGGPDGMDAFEVGDATMKYQLYALYAFSCIIIIVHLLNMLIAIMGNTFAERTEVGSLIMTKDHLRFVMDNWELRKIAFDLPKIKYIICAFSAEEEESEGILGEIKTEVVNLGNDLKQMLKENQAIIKDTQMVVSADNRKPNFQQTGIISEL